MRKPARLEEALRRWVHQALADLQLLPDGLADLEIPIEPPRQAVHGDLATSVALSIASRLKRPAMEIAHALAQKLGQGLKSSELAEDLERIEVKPPGFVNFTLSRSFLYAVLRQILRESSSYGRQRPALEEAPPRASAQRPALEEAPPRASAQRPAAGPAPLADHSFVSQEASAAQRQMLIRQRCGAGRKVLLEFVSANPTGPLSVAHGRQAAVGDALANILDFAGSPVRREYYLNDEGTQINLLGESILARSREALGMPCAFPENGYKGDYVRDLGSRFAERCSRTGLEDPKQLERWRKSATRFGVAELTRVIRREMGQFGVRFDRWFPQSHLNRFGYLMRTLNCLKRRGHLYESDGAWWLKSTAFGDDKDRVVIRSDGRLTYIAADIAYHRRKFQRGFRLLVNLWGPDHHGYIARLKSAVQALGYPAEALQIRIVQLCTLKRGAETIPMSTREGQFVTLAQVIQEVGRDAARFFFLLRKADAHLEFDLELAKRHSLENPVYYIQYAHARIANILKNAEKQRLAWRPGRGQAELLKAPEELRLLRLLRHFPAVVAGCARSLEPFGVAAYLQEVAEGFHRFYDTHRVIGSDARLAAARLDLVSAVQAVLANGLRLLGVSAPDQM